MKKIRYRPEIDGLRAIAILTVLAFHFDLGIEGGFVGVDIFFVISGYLITTQIHENLIAGSFSLIDFYQRRLKRLLPAAVVMMIITKIVFLLAKVLMENGPLVPLVLGATQSVLTSVQVDEHSLSSLVLLT